MKSVYLLRHAKSNWQASFEVDHDRPLAKRGRRAAETIGRFLTAVNQVPDFVISSSAIRAADTARLAAEAGGWNVEIQTTRRLYEAPPTALGAFLKEIPEDADSALLVGHEPVWSETAGLLIGSARIKMVTAALARIDLAVDRWQDVEFGCGELSWQVTPKVLAAFLGDD